MRDPEGTWPPDMERFLRARLERYDGIFEEFAACVNGELVRDYHNQISRHLDLPSTDGITRSIQMTAVTKRLKSPPTGDNWVFDLSIAAWKDVRDDRLFWSKRLRQFSRLPSKDSFRALLGRLSGELKRVKRSDLISVKKLYGIDKLR